MDYVLFVTGGPDSALGMLQSVMQEGDTFSAVAIGGEKLDEILDTCISAGASETYRLMDKAFIGSDTWALARTYAAFAGKYHPGAEALIFARYSSAMPMLAHLIRAQQFCYVADMERDDLGMIVTQDYGDDRRRCRVPSGSVISLKEGVDIPFQDKGASTSDVRILGLEDLELAEMSVGSFGSRVFEREVC
jgi:electron transfer flavoprotein beta subunit